MATDTGSERFSREGLAGYERAVIKQAEITVVGAGAIGNNVLLNLALVGVPRLRIVDPDVVEPSNVSRMPLVDRRRLGISRVRHKAREAALGVLGASHADNPVVRYAVSKVEALGLAGLQGSSVVVAAVDSLAVRAYLSDLCQLLGVPLVEAGFSGSHGQVTVLPNRDPAEPCWRCLHPSVEGSQGVSCALYAAQVVAEGGVPATQPSAALFGALAAENAIRAAHGDFPLGGRALYLDMKTSTRRLLEIALDEHCPGPHHRLGPIRRLAAQSDAPLRDVFVECRGERGAPLIRLPAPFIAELPCGHCGTAVPVARPAWAVVGAPTCVHCPELPRLDRARPFVEVVVEEASPIAERRARALGLLPAAIFEIEDAATGDVSAAQLAGTLDDLFTTKRREGRNAEGGARMDQVGGPTTTTATEET